MKANNRTQLPMNKTNLLALLFIIGFLSCKNAEKKKGTLEIAKK